MHSATVIGLLTPGRSTPVLLISCVMVGNEVRSRLSVSNRFFWASCAYTGVNYSTLLPPHLLLPVNLLVLVPCSLGVFEPWQKARILSLQSCIPRSGTDDLMTSLEGTGSSRRGLAYRKCCMNVFRDSSKEKVSLEAVNEAWAEEIELSRENYSQVSCWILGTLSWVFLPTGPLLPVC